MYMPDMGFTNVGVHGLALLVILCRTMWRSLVFGWVLPVA